MVTKRISSFSPTHDRDQVVLARLAAIEHRVSAMEKSGAFGLRADGKNLERVMKIFGKGKRRAEVYLALDGARSVQEIARDMGIPRQNLSGHLRKLEEEDLIELSPVGGRGDIWAKASMDKSLGISRHLRDHFGIPAKAKKTKNNRTKKDLVRAKRKGRS